MNSRGFHFVTSDALVALVDLPSENSEREKADRVSRWQGKVDAGRSADEAAHLC